MKKSIVFLSFFFVLTSSLISCKHDEFLKTTNGLQYKILVDDKKPKAQVGQVIEYYVYWRTAKDSLFLSTREQNIPLFSRVDKPKFAGDPLEILSLLGTGDSASCYVAVDTIFRRSPPNFLHHGEFMKLDFKVLNVMQEADYDKMMNQKAAEQTEAEGKAIEDYMAKNNLKGEKTPDGMYVVIEDPGKGKQPQSGNTVTVNYTGMLLDGTKFDSSLDPGRTPIDFQIGANQVIKGWDEGIPYFKPGGKGKLIIPSTLGYGEEVAEAEEFHPIQLLFSIFN